MKYKLHELIRTGNLKEIKGWLKSPLDIPAAIDPIHVAANFEQTDIISFFIKELGLNIDTPSQDFKGSTALYDQGFTKSITITQFLIELGADVNAVSTNGSLPFFEFIRGGYLEGLEILLEQGLDLSAQNGKEETALIIALSMRNNQISKWLLEHPIDLDLRDNKGRTALMIALLMRNTEITTLLLEKGANPLIKDLRGINCTAYAPSKDAEALKLVYDFCQKKDISLEDCRSKVAIYQIESGIKAAKGKKKIAVQLQGNFDAIPDSIKDYTTITSLTIRNNAILKDLNLNLFALPNLETLIIEQMPNLETIPSAIGQLKKLKTLHILADNLIYLPDEICHLHSLEELKLNCRFLSVLPSEIGALSQLKKLLIETGALQFMPSSVLQLKTLTHLTLTNQDLDPSEIDIVLYFPLLKELDLQNNSFDRIPKEIINLKHLKKFKFKGNPITNPPIKEIKGGFKGLKKYFEEQS